MFVADKENYFQDTGPEADPNLKQIQITDSILGILKLHIKNCII